MDTGGCAWWLHTEGINEDFYMYVTSLPEDGTYNG